MSYVCEIYNKKNRQNLSINSNVVSISILTNSSFANISNLKVFLEAPIKNNHMENILNTLNILSKTQPYNIAPFNYSGFQKVNRFAKNVVDWILIELRESKKCNNFLKRTKC